MAVIVVERQFQGNKTFDKLHLWTIPVTITGERRATTNLLLDTGAEKTCLSLDVNTILGIKNIKKGEGKGAGVGGSVRFDTGIAKLEIAAIPLGDLEVWIGKLSPKLVKYQIDGLLGADAMTMLSLRIDYPESLLEISKTVVLP